jgi:hypothetical protein
MNEQPTKEVAFWKDRFPRCAGRIKKNPSYKIGDYPMNMLDWGEAVNPVTSPNQETDRSWAQDKIRNPYFLRSEF